ncbi:hypothetical protein [Sphingomonas sp.]|uniref:hypothetical protein n=1 Tax=Sphingomonas sp. TaxID=28214 RepID=UPI0028A2A0E7|nr:hypothetical protein [Sphingomonas sp.]
MTLRRGGIGAIAVACIAAASPGHAQTIPFADTEDATLSEIDVADEATDWHPVLSFDLRNGDYARGALDDDNAGLGRMPVHVALGGAVVLRRGEDGRADLFVIGQNSNGFHAPGRDERGAPRSWYESNTILGLAWRPVPRLDVAALYAIKASPNGVASTTHEASLSLSYTGDDALGRWKPRAAITRRTQGDGGVYTIAGISPSLDLSDEEDGPTLSVPLMAGMGWQGFYGAGTGNRGYASGGLTLAQPIDLAGSKATLQAEMLALVRDDRLRLLDAPGGSTATVIPQATLSLTMAW